MENQEIEYAVSYQAQREARAKEKSSVFLPIEGMRDLKSNVLHLSVSFSGSGSGDIYFSQMVSLYRAVKIKFRWLIIPATVSKVFEKSEFQRIFGDLLEIENIDNEEFWVIRQKNISELAARIAGLDLDNSFLDVYQHDYFPDSV